jgi:death on curing protein
MRYLTLGEVLELHRRIISQSGGSSGLRDLKALESAIAQPRTSFGGTDLYSSTVEKAAAICFSLIKNHPFIDGNKRVGHAAMATFLLLNGLELSASVDSQEIVILGIASGTQTREDLVEWIQGHIVSSGSRS